MDRPDYNGGKSTDRNCNRVPLGTALPPSGWPLTPRRGLTRFLSFSSILSGPVSPVQMLPYFVDDLGFLIFRFVISFHFEQKEEQVIIYNTDSLPIWTTVKYVAGFLILNSFSYMLPPLGLSFPGIRKNV